MVALIRNLTTLPQPAGGYDHLPSPTDITATDDLARIKYYRNKLAHIKDMKITSSFFLIAWEDIKGAVERLGGSQMEEECKALRTKYLNQSTVPWNIRLQFSQIMNQWKKNDAFFVETRAAKHVLKCIMENSCVTITASCGVGKTSTLRHSVLKMANDGYYVLPVTNPDDIVKFYNPEQKTLFVMDDFCGTYSVNQSDLNNWEPVIKRVEKFIQNKLTKIIVACRLQVYRDEKFESLTIFRNTVCNLLSDDLCLLQSERKSIAELYLGTEAADIIQYCDKYDCFPLLCKLHHDNPDLKTTDFFENPFSVYKVELEQLRKKGHFVKYCALALCVITNNAMPEELFTDEISTERRIVIENTCEACRLDKGTSRLSLLDELNSLEQTFIKKEHGVYKTVHDKLFDFLSYYFGKQMIQCIIKNADSNLIMERFLFERENDMDSFTTIVQPKYHNIYIQRLVEDWSIGKVMHVFANNNMEQSKFRQKLLIYLNTLDVSHQRQLAKSRFVSSEDTVLLQCCFRGDIPFTQWCCDQGVDVNLCRFDGTSPLFAASEEGHTQVVKILLDNKADVNKCRFDRTSPLFGACLYNNADIVKLLLENKANVDQARNYDSVTSLCVACVEGYIDIVKMLISYQANINECNSCGYTPLLLACLNNHVGIIKLLIENKADINECSNSETSPLCVACQNNNFVIVKMLLDNKADINMCENGGESPLLAACERGYFDIVELLLRYEVEIDKCLDGLQSALHIACQYNHVDIVKLLLDNNADINKCPDNGESPLFVACQYNHVDIVKLLLENQADINKSRGSITPIFAGCYQGHIEVVELLLEKGADINLCASEDGCNFLSPMQIATQKGHTDIVTLIREYLNMQSLVLEESR